MSEYLRLAWMRRFLTLAFVAVLSLGVVACDDGPAESAGEAVDDAVEETGDALEEATD